MISINSVRVYGLKDSLASLGISYAGKADSVDDLTIRLNVAARLGKKPAGSGEDKFLRFIIVQFFLTASRYFWTELDTYHFLERNSQGTLHCFKSFDYEKNKDPNIDPVIWNRFVEIIEEFKNNPTHENKMKFKANLPEGFAISSVISTNYATLKTIWQQRHNHTLPEWHKFCEFIESLPLAHSLGLYKDLYKEENFQELQNFYII